MLTYGNHFVGKRNVYGLSSREWVNYDYFYALIDPTTNKPWISPYAVPYRSTGKELDGVYSANDHYFKGYNPGDPPTGGKSFSIDIRYDNAVNAKCMFRANYISSIPENSFNNVIYAEEMFGGDNSNDKLTTIPSGSFNKVINGHEMFRNRTNISSIGENSFHDLEDAGFMFLRDYALTGIPSNMFNNVIDAYGMFNIPINFDIPSGYSHLTYLGDNIFNRLENGNGLFNDCHELLNLPENSFSSLTKAHGMFGACSALTSNLIPFITSHPNITSHSECFHYCSAAGDYNQAKALYPDWF